MTEDLYTIKDTTRVRQLLIEEQEGKCALTNVPTANKDFHCDHRHDDQQLVRGALYKQSNLLLGKLEGLYTRYLSYWYPYDLQTFLRQAADYLDKPTDFRWRHPGWIKKVQTKFNQLTEPQKKQVLKALGQPEGSNGKERKEILRKALLTKQFSFDTIMQVINEQKEQV